MCCDDALRNWVCVAIQGVKRRSANGWRDVGGVRLTPSVSWAHAARCVYQEPKGSPATQNAATGCDRLPQKCSLGNTAFAVSRCLAATSSAIFSSSSFRFAPLAPDAFLACPTNLLRQADGNSPIDVSILHGTERARFRHFAARKGGAHQFSQHRNPRTTNKLPR